MSIIETPPVIKDEELIQSIISPIQEDVANIVTKINEEYEYWDTVKYKKCPKGCSPRMLWSYVKASRIKSTIEIWEKYGIVLGVTNQMQRMCHELDMN